MMKTLLLIDAYAMIYRAYYAFIRAPRMNSRGENTSAIFGFVVTLEDLIKRVKPTHLAVAFDPAGPTFRHEAFEQYKAQRQETPEDIRWAVPRIKQLLQAMNIPILQVDGFEADDVIGTLAYQAEAEGFDVYMATPDKDAAQLVRPGIKLYRPAHAGDAAVIYDAEKVCEHWKLSNPLQMIDYLALAGDIDLALACNESARFVVIILYHTRKRDVYSHFIRHFKCGGKLSRTAVKKDEIGHPCKRAVRIGKVRKSAPQRLTQRAVIVRAVRGGYLKGAVVALYEFSALQNYHSCGYMLVTEV